MEKIETVQVAVGYNLDNEIVFTLGNQLKHLQNDFKARLQMLCTPKGAPPEAPRILILTNSFVINIGLNRIDIIMNIPKHINTQFDQILNFCYNTIEGISDYLIDDYVTYKWTGIIANVRYPD